MDAAEQDAIIAGMVRERRQLRTMIACLEQKLATSETEMRDAALGVEMARAGNWSWFDSGRPSFLAAPDLAETMESLRTARTRLSDIEDRLNAC